jgi:hypothetical protein
MSRTTKRTPTRHKPEAAGASAESCPVAALMHQAAQLLQARADHMARHDDFVIKQATDAFESVVSLAATRRATSLMGVAFQLLIGLHRVDDAICGPDLKIRERAHRDVIRVLSAAYEVVIFGGWRRSRRNNFGSFPWRSKHVVARVH